jgi:hypothetical protein
MQRNTANTVEGCSYSLLCVAIGRPSRYSSAWAEDEADIVRDVEESLSVYRRIIIFGEKGSTYSLKETRASRAGSAQVQVARRQRKYMTRHASGKLTPQIPLHPCLASEVGGLNAERNQRHHSSHINRKIKHAGTQVCEICRFSGIQLVRFDGLLTHC